MDAATVHEVFKGLSILAAVIVSGVVAYFAMRAGDS